MSLFNKLTDHFVETSEQMMRVVEEGAAILMGNIPLGEDNGATGTGTGTQDNNNNNNIDIDINSPDFDNMDFDDESADIFNMPSPLNGIAEDVLGDIMKNQAAPTSIMDNINAFKSAITWKEPFILSILAFQCIILLFVIYTTTSKRKNNNSNRTLIYRMILLTIIAGVVRSAERLNTWGSKNWERFATQDYFDQKGVFFSLMICAPLLVTSFGMLIAFLKEAVGLMVEVKTMELKEKARKRNKAEKGASQKGKKKKNAVKQD